MNKVVFLLALTILIGTSGCKTYDKTVYLQQSKSKTPAVAGLSSVGQIRLEPGDLLSIIVTCDDPLLSVPFNTPPQYSPQTINNGYINGIPATQGYLVNSKGEIDLPQIGAVQVGGMDMESAKAAITSRLTQHLSHPIVQLRILNFKVTVLGDVRNPGTFTIPNDRINLFEALAIAGDLNITGQRQNVVLIRTKDNKPERFVIDLTNGALVSNDLFQLKQNDILYVEPNAAARLNSTLLKQSSSIVLPTISIILSTFILLRR
jgi:polysaccharide export outer membrane protein